MSVAEAFGLRAARAEALVKEGGAAVPLLLFAAALLRAQERLARSLSEPGSERSAGPYRAFLADVREMPAPEAAEEADARLEEADGETRARLEALLATRPSGRDDFLGRAFLRARLEARRLEGAPLARAGTGGGCPACGGVPGVGVLRPIPEADGAARSLVCAHCGNEWPATRVRCVACGEDDPARLPVFRSERHPGVRIEACETCRRYLKSLDLSLDARPLPEVDEIVSVSMDLWAAGEGWTRIEPGIAGT